MKGNFQLDILLIIIASLYRVWPLPIDGIIIRILGILLTWYIISCGWPTNYVIRHVRISLSP